VLSPQAEWARIGEDRPRRACVHMLVLSLVPALSSFFLVREVPLPQHAVLATYLAALLAIVSVAAAFWLLARFDSRDATLARCVQVAAYGATPLLLGSALLVSPILVMVWLATLPYAFYLYYLGVQQLLRVPANEALQFVAIALLAACVASTLGGAGIGALGLL